MICLRRTLVKVIPLLKISVKSIKIVLDHENLTYHGGEKINGYCIITLVDILDLDKIYIKFFGQAKTYVETNKSRNAIECQRLFQQYYWPKNYLSSTTTVLKPGSYRIPFHFLVPMNIPSTFEYTFDNHIKYKIKAKFGLTIKSIKVTIFTNPNISISKLLIPVSDFKKKKIGMIGFRKSIKMKCYLPRIGFTVGKIVPVECLIENHTNKSLKLKAILHQQIILMALSERTVCCRKIHRICGPVIPSNSKFNEIFNVSLPERLPIVFDSCNLMHINYILDIYVDIPFGFNIHCRLPIILTYQNLEIENIDLFNPKMIMISSSLSLDCDDDNSPNNVECYDEDNDYQ